MANGVIQRTVENHTEEIIYSVTGNTIQLKLGGETYIFNRVIPEQNGEAQRGQ